MNAVYEAVQKLTEFLKRLDDPYTPVGGGSVSLAVFHDVNCPAHGMKFGSGDAEACQCMPDVTIILRKVDYP